MGRFGRANDINSARLGIQRRSGKRTDDDAEIDARPKELVFKAGICFKTELNSE